MSRPTDPVQGDENYTIEFFQGALSACREKLEIAEHEQLKSFVESNSLSFEVDKLNNYIDKQDNT